MTAIGIAYTFEGFVMAADGRCRSDDPERKHIELETDKAQKIFSVEVQDVSLAYAIAGFAFTDDGLFQMPIEVAKVAENLSNLMTMNIRQFRDGTEYISEFSRQLRNVLDTARQSGRIDEFPKNNEGRICRIFFVGYFKGQPIGRIVKFIEDPEHHIRFDTDPINLWPGSSLYLGSDIVPKLMYFEPADPRFSEYVVKSKPQTIRDAVDHLRNYIKACSSPLAIEVDPQCEAIGGHIHIAEVTPRRGFRWHIPPAA